MDPGRPPPAVRLSVARSLARALPHSLTHSLPHSLTRSLTPSVRSGESAPYRPRLPPKNIVRHIFLSEEDGGRSAPRGDGSPAHARSLARPLHRLLSPRRRRRSATPKPKLLGNVLPGDPRASQQSGARAATAHPAPTFGGRRVSGVGPLATDGASWSRYEEVAARRAEEAKVARSAEAAAELPERDARSIPPSGLEANPQFRRSSAARTPACAGRPGPSGGGSRLPIDR